MSQLRTRRFFIQIWKTLLNEKPPSCANWAQIPGRKEDAHAGGQGGPEKKLW
jgi:hypothetical protein